MTNRAHTTAESLFNEILEQAARAVHRTPGGRDLTDEELLAVNIDDDDVADYVEDCMSWAERNLPVTYDAFMKAQMNVEALEGRTTPCRCCGRVLFYNEEA